MEQWTVYVVSDSTGETGEAIARALMSQFGVLNATIIRFSHIDSKDRVDETMDMLEGKLIIVNSIVIPDVASYFIQRCKERSYPVIDLFGEALAVIEEATGLEAARLPALSRELDPVYFQKISSIEFAVKYDDGKDPRGLLKADIVLVGVSRTSKTPLSMFLANKGYNVANLPLVPEMTLPQEIFHVDPNRMVGLTIQPEALNKVRLERMIALGIPATSVYANDARIEEELSYARQVFDRLKCEVLDVSDSTIEQSAARILEHVTGTFGDDVRRYEKA